jgi:hypothetical protein
MPYIATETHPRAALPAQTRRLQRTTRILLVAMLLGICFLDYWQYSRDSHSAEFMHSAKNWAAVAQGWGYAPQQYRIGIVQSADWLARHTHLAPRHIFTLVDAGALFAGSLLLLGMVEKSRPYRQAALPAQALATLTTLFLLLYALLWLTWYQRAETLPSMLFVVLSCALWKRPEAAITSAKTIFIAIFLPLLALAEGWVRADVACLLHLGFFLTCLPRRPQQIALSRRLALCVSGAGMMLPAAVQLYMMKIAWPHAVYAPDAPPFQLLLNFTFPSYLMVFTLYCLPFFWTLHKARRQWDTLHAPERGLLLASALYLCLWLCVGMADEVRIFLPFAVAAIPLTTRFVLEEAGC